MRERLTRLLNNLEYLKARFSGRPLTEDLAKVWALRYGLFESIQIMIDVCCHLVNRFELRPPQSYRDCIEELVKAGYLPPELEEPLIELVKFRNRLVHTYQEIDSENLQEELKHIETLCRFLEVVEGYF